MGAMGRVSGVAFGLVVALLLGPAIALTVVRWLQPEAGRAVRMISFTPLAIPVYAVAMLLLVAALVVAVRHRRSRVLVAVPALVAAAGLVVHLVWYSPQLLGENPAAAADGATYRVLSANLYEGRADVAGLVGQALASRADVLVAAEVSPEALAAMDEAGLAELLPYRIGRPAGTVEGTMVFARQPITEPERVATTHQSWAVTIGGRLRLLAAHPVAPVRPGAWRRDHARLLAAARAYDADLVVGDLNATADHEPVQRLVAAGYRDAAELTNQGWQPTWPANGLTPVQGLRLPPLVAIDHVMVSDRWAVVDLQTLDLAGTDHLALLAEIGSR